MRCLSARLETSFVASFLRIIGRLEGFPSPPIPLEFAPAPVTKRLSRPRFCLISRSSAFADLFDITVAA
jgi:hypothetical protein